MSLRLPAFHDIPRIVGRDEDETEAKFYKYLTNPNAAPFNYRIARILSPLAFSRALALHLILDGCKRERTPRGKASNEEVLSLLFNRGEGRSVRTQFIEAQYLNIRKDLAIRVPLPFYFVEGKRASGFYLQPRKNFAPNIGEMAMLASMVKHAVLKDDFADMGFEICDLSEPAKNQGRKPTTYTLDSFKILSAAELNDKLQLLAIARDRLVAKGVERSRRAPKRPPAPGPDLLSDL